MAKKRWQRISLALAGLWFSQTAAGVCASLSIEEAVSMALLQNPAVKITSRGEETAEAQLRQAKSAQGFTVTLNSSIRDNKVAGETNTLTNSNGVTASLPIYTGGKNEANIDSSELGLEIARLNTDRKRENIRYDVIKAYYDVLDAQKVVAVDKESVSKYEAHLQDVQNLYQAGAGPKVDVLRSEVELANARQTLIKAENAYAVKLSTLRNIMNMDRNEELILTDDFSYQPVEADLFTCLQYADDKRKDILAAQYEVKQKNLAVKVAEAGYRPTVSLSVGSTQANDLQPSADSSLSYNAGISASWNIFDNGLTAAKVDAAKTAADVAELTLQKTRNDVDLEVRQAYLNMQEAEKRFTSTGEAVKQAEEDFFIAKEKYKAGAGTMLDIIDAQTALSTAKLNAISARYDYARYKAQLENVTGCDLAVTDGEALHLEQQALAESKERTAAAKNVSAAVTENKKQQEKEPGADEVVQQAAMDKGVAE